MSEVVSRLARRRWDLLAAAVVAVAALLPVARALLAGQSLYFRDLGRYYFPIRRFLVEGLLAGEMRYWNPLVFEGARELYPPVSYPLDLLQLLLPNERGFSLTVALHLPLAALGFFVLARVLALPPFAAAAGAVGYALGGFGLSTVNLSESVQALAWAPWTVAAYVLAVERGGRRLVPAAIGTAILFSIGRMEITLQALLLAAVVARPGLSRVRWWRLAAAGALGTLLAAPTLLVMRATMAGGPRGLGLPPELVLGRAIHPLSYLQTLVANLHGDPANLVGRFWGDNFFEPGIFPYFLSFYLGPVLIVLAALGVTSRERWGRGLLLLALCAVWLSLGRWGGLGPIVAALPAAARNLRYPCKAFFVVHFAVCLFAAAGIGWLVKGDARRWLRAALLLSVLGGALVAVLALPLLPSGSLGGLLDLLFPSRYPTEARMAVLKLVARDAARGGILALLAALVSFAAFRRRLATPKAAVLLVLLAGADLLRAGAGLNPSVDPSFLLPSAEMQEALDRLRAEGGRVFTCAVTRSRAWNAARPVQSDSLDVWTFAAMRDALTPNINASVGVAAAFGEDVTAVVPAERASQPGVGDCPPSPSFLGQLRDAGVAHVVSLDPLELPQLRLREVVRPRAIAPLVLQIYDLMDPLPLRFVARQVVPGAGAIAGLAPDAAAVEVGPRVDGAFGRLLEDQETTQRIRLRVFADRPTVVVVRDAWSPGWQATVAGKETPVLRADGRHRAVPVPAGTSDVILEYHPPGLRLGVLLASVAALLLLVLWYRG
jgi:hypothetical protein